MGDIFDPEPGTRGCGTPLVGMQDGGGEGWPPGPALGARRGQLAWYWGVLGHTGLIQGVQPPELEDVDME